MPLLTFDAVGSQVIMIIFIKLTNKYKQKLEF